MDKSGINKVLLGFIAVVVTLLCIPIAMDLRNPISVSAATDYLEDRDYVVFSAAEYALLAKEATAYAAVQNAEAAVIASQSTLATLLLHNENEVFLYPDSVTATVNFTAGTPANNFSAWAEITDSDASTLSSKFAANSGYVVEIMTHDYSVADEIYIIEMAYGANKTVIGRVKLRSDWTYVLALRSQPVTPAGETIYYRMKAETAGASLQADFRYYYNN